MTATFSDFVERDGCARTALILLLLTSVGCMTYTWGYYEGYHNGTYSSMLLIPPHHNAHGPANSTTHNSSSQRHRPIPPPLEFKEVQELLPKNLPDAMPRVDDTDDLVSSGHVEEHQGHNRLSGQAESEAADGHQGGETVQHEGAGVDAAAHAHAAMDTRRMGRLL